MISVVPFKRKYFTDVCRMVNSEWDMGKTLSKTKNLLPTKYYFYRQFSEYPRKDFVLLDNDKVIGYIAISDNRHRNNFIKRVFYKLAMWFCFIRMKDHSGFKKFWKYYDFEPSPDSMWCDCELLDWIIHKDYRKNKNGKFLFKVAEAWAKSVGLTNMFIYTDDTCSFWVYDLMGAERVLEHTIKLDVEDRRCSVFGTGDGGPVETEHAIIFRYKIQ